MSWFTNPIRGFLGNVGASMTKTAHFGRYPARNLRVESYELFKRLGAEKRLFKKFEKHIRKGLKNEIAGDEDKLLKVTQHVCEEVRLSLKDIVMVGHLQLELLKKILMDDEELKQMGLKSIGEHLQLKVRAEITRTYNVLNSAGNTLLSIR